MIFFFFKKKKNPLFCKSKWITCKGINRNINFTMIDIAIDCMKGKVNSRIWLGPKICHSHCFAHIETLVRSCKVVTYQFCVFFGVGGGGGVVVVCSIVPFGYVNGLGVVCSCSWWESLKLWSNLKIILEGWWGVGSSKGAQLFC